MEKNLDRKTLSFSKGMTNIPSDLLSDDSELLESVGFIYKDGEMKPIQEPKYIGNIPYKIMYVHKQADYENIIAYDESSVIYWYKKSNNGNISSLQDSFNVGSVSDIKSVGNTLICATDQGLHYLLFKGGAYKDLGTELPKPDVRFKTFAKNVWIGGGTVCNIQEMFDVSQGNCYYDSNGKLLGYEEDSNAVNSTVYFKYSLKDDVDKISSFQTAVQGHIAARINALKEKNYFCFPFFVRYAIKLFDGSYTRISNPILIFPTINRNCQFTPVYYNKDTKGYEEVATAKLLEGAAVFVNTFSWKPWFSSLYYKAYISDIGNWSDIVKEIVVFASDDVMPFRLSEDFEFKQPVEMNGVCYANQVSRDPHVGVPWLDFGTTSGYNQSFEFNYSSYPGRDVIQPKNYKSDSEIIDELLSKTQFYKLFSVNVDDSSINPSDIETYKIAPIKAYTVSNLTEQEQLQKDDYYSWAHTIASTLYPYNKRLNIIGMKRTPFDGFSFFIPIMDGSTNYGNNYSMPADLLEYDIYTHIVSDSMDCWVKSSGCYPAFPEMLRSWLYYPDPNATEMRVVKKGTSQGVSIKLKVHPMLNGSYYFGQLPYPRVSTSDFSYSDISIPIVDSTAAESLDSQIFTSVVNNPFVFEASGDNTVGTGTILGIVANTEAVSQGQFGQYPLMVFTDEGIYGMSVNSEGLYSATYPISREVCLNNSPLVPTDKLIFFASKKGLMAASGGQVACMSELMRGRVPRNFASLGEGKFLDFLENCQIAYDYKDSLLRIFCEGKSYQYIYNMIDKTFSMIDSGVTARSIVNDYPDNLIQGTDGSIYSLTSKPEINDDTNVYNGTITTRPLKLGGSMTLKSLRAIKNLLDTDEGKISLEIYGSNDCKHWQKLVSMGGKPYKYFTFKYKLNNFKAVDSFVGSIVEIQSRREDKIR